MLKIRLARKGAKKHPFYRIVVADERKPRDGAFIERLGHYNPMLERNNSDRVVLNEDRIKYWLSVGAQPTDRVALFLGKAKIIEMPKIIEKPKKSLPKKKAQELAKKKAEAEKNATEQKASVEENKAQSEPKDNSFENKDIELKQTKSNEPNKTSSKDDNSKSKEDK